MLKTSSLTDSLIYVTQIAVKNDVVDGSGGKLVKKLSKNPKSLKGLENLQRSLIWRNQAFWLLTLG